MKLITQLLTAILLLALTVSGCSLPEVTPPVTEAAPSLTPAIQVPPLETPTVELAVILPEIINSANTPMLTHTHKAAVSNVQKATWSSDSRTIALITQNTDSAGNPIYGVTTLNSSDLSTKNIYSSEGDRIVAVAADGLTAALISADLSSYNIVDTTDPSPAAGKVTPGYLVGNLSFSPDLKYIAVTKMESWEVVLIDFKTQAEVRSLSGFETAAPVFNAVFDQSPQWIVWVSRGTIHLQDVESGNMGMEFNHQDFVTAYALSPDGTTLASSAPKIVNNNLSPVISQWDTSSGIEIRSLQLDASANALAFSPDGSLLAAAVGNNLQIWDARSGTLLTTLTGHSDIITQVAFSPDQKSILTSALDNQLYLWQTGK